MLSTPTQWREQIAGVDPLDVAISATSALATLPVIGKYLEPLGTMTAVAAWLSRYANAQGDAEVQEAQETQGAKAPDMDAAAERANLADIVTAALRGIVSPADLDRRWPSADPLPPVLHAAAQRRRYLHRSAVRYGPSPRQVLDVWRRSDLVGPAPVLVFVPGGGWLHGGRVLQGYALMSHLAQLGWVCLSVEYRVSPHNRWPRHVQDVKAAIAWARANADRFGGDPRFVAAAGCSAGGHLASLAGLTPGDPTFDADLASDADTSVDAVVGLYGRYDFADRSTRERDEFVGFVERVIVRDRIDEHPEVFRDASPIERVTPNAPPFLVVHGTGDGVIPVPQARAFVERLRATSRSHVGYVELPGAGHAFDLTDRVYTRAMTQAVALFLTAVHRSHTMRVGRRAI
jgi:acetyl esterase/lipase